MTCIQFWMRPHASPHCKREVGALGFEPKSAGFFRRGSYPPRCGHRSSRLRVIAPVIHHCSANPSAIIPITGAHKSTRLAYTPTGDYLLLPQTLGSLLFAHLLFAPFPALLPALFPYSGAPFHGISSDCLSAYKDVVYNGFEK